MELNARNAAFVLGIVFLIVGVLGYVPNPIVGHTSDGSQAIFAANTTHNLVHIISGIFLLLGAYTALTPSLALKILGIVYALVAVLGFIMPGENGMMLGMIEMNMADHLLHVVLAVIILAAGFALPATATAAV
ncbi:MAG: DUF4383 domain-containing protein [Alphaproteobacteria bacterium]|nr:DUF4383 domain-containing protein [Alphaproteobacteria bacterium]